MSNGFSVTRIGDIVRALLWIGAALNVVASILVWAVTEETGGRVYGAILAGFVAWDVLVLLCGYIMIQKATRP